MQLAVILAGGLASRMGGGDKCLIELDGRSLLSRTIDRLRPQAAAIALNANGDAARFSTFGLPVLPDTVPGHVGPLAGILAAMEWAAGQGATHVLTVAGDTPFFPDTLSEKLQGALHGNDHGIAIAATRGNADKLWRHPTFGLWPVGLRDDLKQTLHDGTRKVVVWADRHGVAPALFEVGEIDPFFNINTTEDLARAKSLLAQISG